VPQRLSRSLSGHLAICQDQAAIHQYITDTRGILMRHLKSGSIADNLFVEDY
jgi:hypothetical protein